MAKNKIPQKCPSCNRQLRIETLKCDGCQTVISGEFRHTPFDYLSDDEQKFMLDFVKSGGNIKEVAKNMNLSYPTVRKILDELIKKVKYYTSPSFIL